MCGSADQTSQTTRGERAAHKVYIQLNRSLHHTFEKNKTLQASAPTVFKPRLQLGQLSIHDVGFHGCGLRGDSEAIQLQHVVLALKN
jgi:hypothetical protein